MDLSVVIPAFNEEKRLEKTLIKIIDYCKKNLDKYEIIVVDDCSTDETSEVAAKFQSSNLKILQNPVNRGKGYSVKRGILESKFPLVLFSDSDLATPIEELDKFLDFINQGYDIVIASRNLKESNIQVKQPFYRQFMGRTFPYIVSLIALRGFKDTQCGFKLFRTDLAKKIVNLQTFERFSFDVELLFIAKKLGCRIKEAPVVWIDQKGSKVSPLRDSFKMFKDLFILRYNNILGRYKVE